MKGVQATDVEIDEDDFEEVVDKVRGDHEKKRAEKQEDKPSKNKVSHCDSAASCPFTQHPVIGQGQGDQRRLRCFYRFDADGR